MTMMKANRSTFHSVFRGLSKTLAGVAGILFIFGGGIISRMWNINRGTAEFIGLAVALGLGLLALFAHAAAEQFDDGEAGDNQPSRPASI